MQYNDKKTLQLNKKLGELVKQIRLKKFVSANRLSNEYDLDSGNLSRIEHGSINCKYITVWRIAEALGLRCSELTRMLEKELGEDFKLMDE